ncbi:hypothetical protein F5B22DRAFT_196972 [Xylaria bambusicola]|uniref:uncharacterized protein n=1 Tax=Xylaria bambusicola TaxID=326684 RepID=UPI002007D2A9|nr:uncharacterized protein F5B22DRAFT_196972 [Xylaria bambusicola]KAI0515289.1 hypothetical protein F5B22DRAFT_196972 [Xylaria bambusicola]
MSSTVHTESPRALPSSIHRPHHRQQSLPLLRQASFTASLSHAAMPPDTSEWKHIMDEIKRKYLARKYRSCSMQCCDVLANIKEESTIEPLHRIYLHFYAASSFEWCARPLSSSTYREELLRSAQTHYAEAEVQIAAMEFNMTERASSPSSARSSSPSLSARSRTPDLISTASSSPRTSGFFLDDPPTKAARQARMKAKKKVSFSSFPQLFEFQPEPHIRPDSPTLGLEDPIFIAMSREMDASISISPKKHSSPTSIIKTSLGDQSAPARIMSLEEFESRSASQASAILSAGNSDNPDRCSTPSNHTFDLESFIQARTLNRLRGQLLELRDQVCRHRTVVDSLLSTAEDPHIARTTREITISETQPSSTVSTMNHVRHQSASVNATQAGTPLRPTLRIQTDLGRSDAPVSSPSRYHHLRKYNSVSAGLGQSWGISSPVYAPSPRAATPGIPSSPLSAGGDSKNLQDRIERLRANGWQRKRFDSRRYEVLREQVLGELEPCR